MSYPKNCSNEPCLRQFLLAAMATKRRLLTTTETMMTSLLSPPLLTRVSRAADRFEPRFAEDLSGLLGNGLGKEVPPSAASTLCAAAATSIVCSCMGLHQQGLFSDLGEVLSWSKRLECFAKQDPGRARQSSYARAGRKFSQPRKNLLV